MAAARQFHGTLDHLAKRQATGTGRSRHVGNAARGNRLHAEDLPLAAVCSRPILSPEP